MLRRVIYGIDNPARDDPCWPSGLQNSLAPRASFNYPALAADTDRSASVFSVSFGEREAVCASRQLRPMLSRPLIASARYFSFPQQNTVGWSASCARKIALPPRRPRPVTPPADTAAPKPEVVRITSHPLPCHLLTFPSVRIPV